MTENDLKHCNRCKTDRKRKFFSRNRKRKDGLQAECKFCQCDRYKAARQHILAKKAGQRAAVKAQGGPLTKRCVKCGNSHALKYFSKDRHRKDGLQSACKYCDAVYAAGYRAAKKATRGGA